VRPNQKRSRFVRPHVNTFRVIRVIRGWPFLFFHHLSALPAPRLHGLHLCALSVLLLNSVIGFSGLCLIAQTIDEGDVSHAQELLESLRPRQGQEDLRSFDWFYLHQLASSERSTLTRRIRLGLRQS
jgi:hypothetical protein